MSIGGWHYKDQPIPKGLTVYLDRLNVAGMNYRINDAKAFAKVKNPWLEFEREPDNQYDKNAIKVFGCSKGFFGTKRRFIGYVPKDAAKLIVEKGYWEKIQPRLLVTGVDERGWVDVGFQILGPKETFNEFSKQHKKPSGHYTDYVERVKLLKKQKRHAEAIKLLQKLIVQVEKESDKLDSSLPPWYYEQLAIVCRKEKRYGDEVSILERYTSHPKAIKAAREILAERLSKAKQIRDKKR